MTYVLDVSHVLFPHASPALLFFAMLQLARHLRNYEEYYQLPPEVLEGMEEDG